jgi:hypothetical protein
MKLNVGQTIPLYTQTYDYNPSVYPQAVLRDQNNNILSTVNLTAIGGLGLYGNNSIVFPSGTAFVTVQYIFYSDSGHTVVSSVEGAAYDVFYLDSESSSTGSAIGSYIVGILDGPFPDDTNPAMTQDTIVSGSDRLLYIRLVSNPNALPFDLSDATLVSCRFNNNDGTVLVLNSTDSGNPVVVTAAQAGEITCQLTNAQTSNLQLGTPAAFVVIVVQPAGTTVVNFPWQLGVEAQLV